jgi:UMF1 family MFS transporter
VALNRNNRALVGWVLYDLANTIFSLNIVSLYFSVWVVNVMGGTDSTYAIASSGSMIVVFLIAPFLGALTDQAGRRLPFLLASTLLCVGSTLLLGRTGLAPALMAFAIANIGYQAGLQFYDALLPIIAPPERRGRTSGLGVGVGYLGSVVGLSLGRLLLSGVEELSREAATSRYATLFTWTGLLFLAFSVPCFLFVREGRRQPEAPPASRGSEDRSRVFGRAWRQSIDTLKTARDHPGLVRFLLARALYTDAVNTVVAFMGIYVTNAVGFTSDEASLVLLLAILFAALGGLAWGRVVDRLGPLETLERVLGLWVVVFAWTAIVGWFRLHPAAFWPVPVLAGIALGGTWTADRPFLLELTPPGRVGEYYGLYGMVGRFSAITGPLLWAFVSETVGLGRPAAVATLLIFVIAAWIILRPLSAGVARSRPQSRKARI